MRPLLKPGTRWLLLVGLVALALTFTPFGRRVERRIYDLQMKLALRWWADTPLASELVLVGLDRTALEMGFTESDLRAAPGFLESATSLLVEEEFEPFFRTDPDGVLREVKLYVKGPEGVTWSPMLLDLASLRQAQPSELRLENGRVFLNNREIPSVDGAIRPIFHRSPNASLRMRDVQTLPEYLLERLMPQAHFSRLSPVSLSKLGEIAPLLKGKLTVFGHYSQGALDSTALPTPTGPLEPLEFYGSTLDALIKGEYLLPLPGAVDLGLTLAFLLLVSLALPGKASTNAIGTWGLLALLWLSLHAALIRIGSTGTASVALLASLAMLLFFLISRSRILARYLYGFGGRDLAAATSEEVDATICFTNLPDLIKELEKRDLATAEAARTAYAELLGHLVQRHQGRLVDQQGDAQMIAFGLEGDGTHAIRAVACCLELVEASATLLGPDEPELAYCGIVTGPVARGQVGGGAYRSIAAIGDTTNAAARLMGQARKLGKTVLAARTTTEKLGPRATTVEVGEVQVKGRQEPIKVDEVLSLSEPPQPCLVRPRTGASKLSAAAVVAAVLVCTVSASRIEPLTTVGSLLLDSVTPSDRKVPIYWAGLDQETLSERGWPWPRSWHAQVIANCREAGVSCLFYDVLFDLPSEPEQDRALVEAVQNTPSVVLAAASEGGNYYRAKDRKLPKLIPGLLETERWALINIAQVEDEELVRHALWETTVTDEQGRVHPARGVAKAVCQVVAPEKAEPLRDQTRFLIRWGPEPEQFSYHRLLDPKDPIFDKLKNAVVVVADALPGPSDTAVTPTGTLKGGLVHCLSIQTVLGDDLMWDKRKDLLPTLLTALFVVTVLLLSNRSPGLGAQFLLLLVAEGVGLLIVVGVARTVGLFLGSQHLIAIPLALAAAAVLRSLDLARALQTYVPASVRRQLERDGFSQGKTSQATVFLSDIRGYTTLSEGRSPVEVLGILNRYHELTAALYQQYGGHLVTYQGDAQIVIFGALEPLDNPAGEAFKAARKVPRLLREVEESVGLKPGSLRVGVGLASGDIRLSVIRAGDQLQFTAVGETVRRAHQLQHLSDEVGSDIILDKESQLAVQDLVRLREHLTEEGGCFYTPVDP